MKKLTAVVMLMGFICHFSFSQGKIERTFDTKEVRHIDLSFKYPELIKVKTWNKQEVKVSGTVDIDQGKGNDKFKLEDKLQNGILTIASTIENIDQYERFIIPSPDNDQESMHISAKGWRSDHIEISIQLEITVPKEVAVQIEALYGMVEIVESPANVEVDARYGGIDVAIHEASASDIMAKTQWGQIYSNLDIVPDLDGNPGVGDWVKAVVASRQDGSNLRLKSQYGNVYLRKAVD